MFWYQQHVYETRGANYHCIHLFFMSEGHLLVFSLICDHY